MTRGTSDVFAAFGLALALGFALPTGALAVEGEGVDCNPLSLLEQETIDSREQDDSSDAVLLSEGNEGLTTEHTVIASTNNGQDSPIEESDATEGVEDSANGEVSNEQDETSAALEASELATASLETQLDGEQEPEEVEEPRTGWETVDGEMYYRDENGERVSGLQTIDGEYYYFDPSTYASLTEWCGVDGKTYYFDPKTHRAVKYTRDLVGTDGNLHSYYFNGAGVMQTGFITWTKDGTRSYYDPSTGAALTGWQDVSGKTYYFHPTTLRAVRYIQNGLIGRDGKKHDYYFNGLGQMFTGLLKWGAGDYSYYDSNGAASSGFVHVGTTVYYMSPSTLHSLRYSQVIGGKHYYFDSKYRMVKGWLTWGSDKSRSFYGDDGAAVSGWKTDGNAKYYISPTTLHTVRGLQTIQGKKYYFNTVNTILIVNNWVNMGGGTAGWAASDGVVTVNTAVKYDSQGILRGTKAGWLTLNSKQYFINKDLSFAIGWLSNGGYWYYLDPASGGAMVSGTTVTIDGYKRVFDNKGRCSKVGYQNPSNYYQVSSWTAPKSCASGIFSYVTPSMISADASRTDCIEAFIKRAYDYLDTPYVWDYACAPGVGVDCSGLVTQCLYAAGVVTPYTPYAHYHDPWQDHNAENMRADNKFKKISFSSRNRGDLIFYSGHVAIYLGNDRIIHALSPSQGVLISSVYSPGAVTGCSRVFV